jgi:subfamily B ATP-binding cassette protein MsbA
LQINLKSIESDGQSADDLSPILGADSLFFVFIMTYQRLLQYARPYKTRLIAGTVFGLLFGLSHLGLLKGMEYALSNLFGDAPLKLSEALMVAAVLPLVGIIFGIGNFFSKYFMTWVGQRVVMQLRTDTFAHIHKLSMAYFTKSRTGELISRTTNDSMLVERAVSNVLADLVREPFTLISAIGYIVWLDLRLAAISLIAFPICIVPVAIFGKRVRKVSRQGQEKLADMVSTIDETISGVRIVKSFCTEEREMNRFNAQAQSVFHRAIRITKAKAALEPIIVTIAFTGLSLVFVYANMVAMPIQGFFTFAIALFVMYQPVKKLSSIHLVIQQSSAAAERIFEILDTPIEVIEQHDAPALGEPIREIKLENLSFAYEKDPVLQGLNLTISSGEFLALVGSSGSGKTTLISLLARFYDPTSGRILLNGRDMKDLDLKSVRRQIGMVTQDTVLFNETVASNIAYGLPDASPEQITQAARRAHALDFINELPQGFETHIGERGTRLSGGQRQRLAIARALLLDPPILLLDEATSALDTESERQVQLALDEMMHGRTVIAIAHRLSTIQKADRILVFKDGQIVEEGSHEQLLAEGGHYKYLYELQFKS